MATATAKRPLTDAEKKANAEKRAQAKVANFKKLAGKRVSKVLAGLQGVAALSNKNSYTYDHGQVTKIIAALEAKVKEVQTAFLTAGGGTGGFSL